MKDVFLVVLGIICAGLIAVLIWISQKDEKISKHLDEERFGRMVAEESLQKSAAKLSTLEVQLKSANDKLGKVENLIEQQKSANADLQKQYEELSRIKAELEAKIKAAEANPVPASTQ
jgi:septal ring factor EnvC (AmiA/AmiB activator)